MNLFVLWCKIRFFFFEKIVHRSQIFKRFHVLVFFIAFSMSS